MCACADVLNFKYRDLKMFLLKLESELQNLIKKFQPILTEKYRLYFHEVECTPHLICEQPWKCPSWIGLMSALHKKYSFPLRISSVNVTKCEFLTRHEMLDLELAEQWVNVLNWSIVLEMVLEISPNSQESTCLESLCQRCFSLILAKFLTTPFLQNTCEHCFYQKTCIISILFNTTLKFLKSCNKWLIEAYKTNFKSSRHELS